MGGGVSGAHYVLAENGSEYIAKGPSLAAGEPYVAVNELISAMAGQVLGLPVLDFAVLEMGGELLFGGAWMQQDTFDPAISPATLAQCVNLDRIYDLVAFDSWLCNEDRHDQNLMVRRRKLQGGAPEQLFLLLNDHSRCLLPPQVVPSGMAAHWLGSSPDRFIRLDYVRAQITDCNALARAVDAIEGLQEDMVRTLVRMVPEELLSVAERLPIEDFLLARQAELRRVFNAAAISFPALQGAML
ncbi:MAG: hypothetical protein M3Q10_13155 [Chloroflexota bacterium]|nr:hypothetical protein [Chloroflexota bacterium]